jgi:hypothetical protein
MAIRRVKIDHTVYPPNFVPHKNACWNVRTIAKARLLAKRFGTGSLIYTNFNQTNKKGRTLGGFWDGKVLEWTGAAFKNDTAKKKNLLVRDA